MVAPRLGEEFPEIAIAEEQLEYKTLTASPVLFDDGSLGLITRWAFTVEEKERVARGEDLFLTILTHGLPMQPVILGVGLPEWLNKDPGGQ
jgi:hypothetical protein